MANSRPPPSKSVDLDLTIVSAKHLKNVNWKNGPLRPYVVFWLDPDRRLATKSDDSASTKPVWNERFTLPLPHHHHHLDSSSSSSSFLTIEVFHSRPSDTPKPLVGSLRIPLRDLDDLSDPTRIRKFNLTRPSGRPQGKIYLKLGLLGRNSQTLDYANPNPNSSVLCYLPSNPVPQSHSARDYRGYVPSPSPSASPSPSSPPYPAYSSSSTYGSYSDPYSGYYPGYYSGAPPPPRPFLDRPMGYTGPAGPSAPLDYSSYEQKPKGGKMGMGLGSGLAVGAAAGALSGLALDEGAKYEEEKIAERVESGSVAARDDYGDYQHRVDY